MRDPLAPFRWALQEKGQSEIAGHDHNRRIIWYHSFTTLKATDDETPWCSAFMNAAAVMNGYEGTGSAAAISWKDYGIPGTGQPGDIAVLPNHVAFIHAGPSHGRLILFGGNQQNKVGGNWFSEDKIIAIRRFPD